jgi:hypothetical protein
VQADVDEWHVREDKINLTGAVSVVTGDVVDAAVEAE